MEYYHLENGDTIQRIELSYFEFVSLSDVIVKVYEYMPEEGIALHELQNGKCIVEEDNIYFLYESVEKFELVYQDREKKSHILYNKNPYGNDFPRHVHMLIEQLLMELKIDVKIKVNQKMLKIIDKKIKHKNFTHLYNDFASRYFIHIIAVAGEAIIRCCDANWLMKPTQYEDIWMPYIKKRNRSHDLISNLYHDMIRTQDEKSPLNKAYEYGLYELL